MEFQFETKEILPARVTVIGAKDSSSILQIHGLKTIYHHSEANDWTCNSTSDNWDATLMKKKEHLEKVVDQMGLASAQNLDRASPITTLKKLLDSHQQKLYIIRSMENPCSVIGILKIGQRRLFVSTDMNVQYEVDGICVLDFYVHESRQRCGYGHELFESMLKNENFEPAKLAFDCPSEMLLEFLSKHYNLTDPRPQNNNFVVYPGFLDRADLHHRQHFTESKHNEDVRKENSFDTSITIESNHHQSKNHEVSHESKDQKCSCPGKCHHRIENNPTLDDCYQKQQVPKAYKTKETSCPYENKHEQNWGVFDSMHSYSGNKDFPNSANCILTGGNNEEARVERNMTQLQSSWNVLGVHQKDYSKSE